MEATMPIPSKTVSFDITLDEGVRLADVKKAINMIKGITKVKVKSRTAKETTEFPLEDLNKRIKKADEDYLAGRCIGMQQNETAEDFINRMLCATT